MKRADGCREGAECFWNSAEDTGGRLLVNDEKREEQGLKERKASPIREHERISVFSFLGFQKRGAADLGSPRRFRSQEGSAFLRFQGIRIVCYAVRRRNGRELSGVKRERRDGGRPVWGLKLLYCGFRRNGRGQILEKERRGFLAALVKGWKI